ncbi:MAG: TetR/AcrR family transcriptional regulator [Candidatus Cloacimonadales bacterium]
MAYNKNSAKVLAKKESKRQAIMEAVIKTVAEKGFHKTNISEIAEMAGVADGTVYLYFKNKDEMFMQAFEALVKRKLAKIKLLLEAEATALDRLNAFFDHHIALITRHPYIARFIGIEIRQSPQFYQKFPGYLPFRDYLRYLQELIEAAKAEGSIADVDSEATSYIIFGTMDYILAEWATHDQNFPLAEMKDRIRHILRYGLLKRGE